MEEILQYFANKIREERTRRKLSQEDLALKAGVHRTYIGMIERAEKNITLRNIDKLSQALGISISELFKEYHPTDDSGIGES